LAYNTLIRLNNELPNFRHKKPARFELLTTVNRSLAGIL
jgi:hypothetical protein